MKIGKASYGGGGKKTYFKMKDGDNVYRILPPLGELADKGIWSVFYNVHYGYKNSDGKLRPFQSSLIKNYKTKMIEASDAALERIEKLKAQLAEAKASGNTVLVQKLNEFVGPKGSFNLDNNHYVNAVDAQGNIGILKIRHRAKQALDVVIKRLREKGIDPLSVDNGRFFVITRSGTGLDTTFQVNVLTRTINVPNVGDVQQEVVHALDESIIARLAGEAADLGKLFKKPTPKQIARIVTEGAVAVDEILDGKGQGTTGSSGGEDYDDSAEYAEESGSTAQSAAPAAPASAPVAAAPVTPPITVTAPVQAAAQAAPAPVSAPVTANVASSTSTTAAQVNEMSDADFLKSLGL